MPVVAHHDRQQPFEHTVKMGTTKTSQSILLTALIAVSLLATDVVLADHEKKKNKSKQQGWSEGQNLDQFKRNIKKKDGRVLKIIRDESGNVKAKVLTKDGRVRYLSIDPNGD
jgi:hypothetical protein